MNRKNFIKLISFCAVLPAFSAAMIDTPANIELDNKLQKEQVKVVVGEFEFTHLSVGEIYRHGQSPLKCIKYFDGQEAKLTMGFDRDQGEKIVLVQLGQDIYEESRIQNVSLIQYGLPSDGMIESFGNTRFLYNLDNNDEENGEPRGKMKIRLELK